MSEIAEALESMLASAGWKLYVGHVAEEWGPKAYAERLKAAVRQARAGNRDASHAIELVDAANDAVAEAMRWPAEHASRLQRQQIQPSEMTMADRRGGL